MGALGAEQPVAPERAMRSTPRLGFVLVVCVLGACASDLDGRLSEGTDSAPAVAEDQRAAARLTVAEFRGSWDPVSGVFDVEVVEPAASALGVEVEPFREFDQALYCEPRRTYGFSDTIGLVTVAGSIGTSAGACGFGGFPYDILGGFCATIRVSSYYTSLSLTSVTAEIVAVNPPEYTGYEYPLGTGADPTGGDPVRGIAQGDGQPTDAGGGLFLHGEIVPGGVAETMWMFRNPGGAFEFSGRIMAGVVEADNDLDDNCDGWIDDRLGEYADEADCRFDIDCQSGLCHDIDTGTAIGDCAETCSEGRYGDPCVDCPGGSGDAQCSGNGTCDDGAPGTGVCTCATNFAGADCSACVPDHFGPACDPCPECLNSGVCGDGSGGSGACVCPTGVHGDVCEFTCADESEVCDGADNDCNGGVDEFFAPFPACHSLSCSGEGLIHTIPDGCINDGGGSAGGDSLQVYCRNGIARFCLSGESCAWRSGAASSTDFRSCSRSGLGSDYMANAWCSHWNGHENYYCDGSSHTYFP